MSNNRIINIATIAYLAFLLIILAIFGYTPRMIQMDIWNMPKYACIKEKHIHVVLLLRALLLYGTLAPST